MASKVNFVQPSISGVLSQLSQPNSYMDLVNEVPGKVQQEQKTFAQTENRRENGHRVAARQAGQDRLIISLLFDTNLFRNIWLKSRKQCRIIVLQVPIAKKKGYRSFKENYVNKFRMRPNIQSGKNKLFLVKSLVCASTKTQVYTVYVHLLRDKGKVLKANCSCN